MKFAFATGIMLAGLAFCTPALADPSGSYTVSGTNPGGGSTYAGSVAVSKTGDTFKVSWTVGSDSFVGTAIGNDQILSVGYDSGGKPGVALFVQEGGVWKGVWTFLGETSSGTETWTK